MTRLDRGIKPKHPFSSSKFVRDFFDGFEEIGTSKYPPVNVKTVMNHGRGLTNSYKHAIKGYSYEIEVATAGFRKDELTITCEDRTLHIKGSAKDRDPRKQVDDQGQRLIDDVINQIALRDFHKVFTFGTDIEVESATYVDGLLKVKVVPKAPKEGKVVEIT